MADGRAVDAWKRNMEAHLTPVYRFVRNRVPARSVDDVVQEIFVAATKNAMQFDPDRGTTWQWLVGIARRQIARHYRQVERTSFESIHGVILDALVDESPLPDAIGEREEFRAFAREALTILDPRLQECLIARYHQDQPLAQIAERLNLSRSAVNSRLFRARVELAREVRRLIGQDIADEEIVR